MIWEHFNLLLIIMSALAVVVFVCLFFRLCVCLCVRLFVRLFKLLIIQFYYCIC